jgi:hypothetical protein
MAVSLDHDKLKLDLDGAARALGVEITRQESRDPSLSGRVELQTRLVLRLPRASNVHARFVREGLVERAKKLFVAEVEVGSAVFDDGIYVVTSTRDATHALLAQPRVQQALLLLVDDTRHVEVDGTELRVLDADATGDHRDATAEALALAAHLV